jgi:steroid delta-isomerase-like uncharacterized protein
MTDVPVQADVRSRRAAIVQAHIDAENCQDVTATLVTFSTSSAAIDIPAFGAAGQRSGHEDVKAMYEGLFAAFPDFHADSRSMRHGDDHVLVEARMSGTQHADWAGIVNTGRSFSTRLAAIFDFDGEQLVRERAYLDFADITRQLAEPA